MSAPLKKYDTKALWEKDRDHNIHPWTDFASFKDEGSLVMSHSDGAYVFDSDGNRFMDGIGGLWCVNIGYVNDEMAEAIADQVRQIPYYSTFNHLTTPPAATLAAKLAELAPGDLNRVFFTTGGSEAVESAWKLARQYFKLLGQPDRVKVISRNLAYHGTTMGALSITGLESIKTVFEPLVPGAVKVPETNHYRCPTCQDDPHCSLHAADAIEEAILREGPETVAAVFLEPVQNAGGCFVPPPGYFTRVREICDRYGVLLVSDEVICAYGRLGHMFGCERYGYQPDMITSAKGLTSGYSPLGAMLVSDRVAEPFVGTGDSFLHGITFAGHPVSCAVALANLQVFADEKILDHVQANEAAFRSAIDDLADLPIVGDVRGAGYFYGIELVRERDGRVSFTDDERERLLRGFLSNRLLEIGLICRADDRGEPVIQLSPPLVAGPAEFEEINAKLRQALTEAMAEMGM